MAVPGFSVNDLIQALGQAKTVYDAFFNEYTNTASQLRDLADDIEQFRINLVEHEKITKAHGLEYSGYQSVQRTLKQCYSFLDKYKAVIDERSRKSVVGAFKTAKFAFDTDGVEKLRAQIARHQNNIGHFTLNHVLSNTLPRSVPVTPTAVSPLVIPARSHDVTISPPATPPLSLPSPLLSHSGFSNRSRLSASPTSAERPLPPLFEDSQSIITASPQLMPINQSPVHQPTSSRSSPALQNNGRSSQSTLNIPGLVLPQPALPYLVAEVHFAKKKVELKRKAVGNNTESGREMVIVDENGNLRYRHRIKIPRTESCFPYTWHRKWQKDSSHGGFVVDFIDTPPEAHSISFKSAPPISAVPKYIFRKRKDFEDFQSELHGKRLDSTFEVRKISSASSSKLGEATHQHLKIWQDYITRECYVSFYASAIKEPRHREFPLAMFEQDLGFDKKAKEQLCLNFALSPEPKRSRTYSRAFSRSPSEATTATNTTITGIFSSNNTEVASSASSITTTTSRTTTGLHQFEGSTGQSDRLKPELSLKSLAKDMKYFKIEFTDEIESSRFKQTYDRLHQEDKSRSQDFFLDWGMKIERERAESVVSSSPNGTPFTMSPVIRPIQTRTGTIENG